MSHVDKPNDLCVQGLYTSIFVMYRPGTTMSPIKRLVMSTFKVDEADDSEDDSEDAPAAALTASGVGWRYS